MAAAAEAEAEAVRVTLGLLTGRRARASSDLLQETVRDWLDSLAERVAAGSDTCDGVPELPLCRSAPPPPPARARRRGRFSHPHVRSRLEMLMGSNITRLTDRRYMQRLAERIQEDHEDQLLRRIKEREEAEVEREKRLILEGKIPVEEVPEELADHPVFKVSRMTSRIIEKRRSEVSRSSSMRQSYMPTQSFLAFMGGTVDTEASMDAHEREDYAAEVEVELRTEEAEEDKDEDSPRQARAVSKGLLEEAIHRATVYGEEEEMAARLPREVSEGVLEEAIRRATVAGRQAQEMREAERLTRGPKEEDRMYMVESSEFRRLTYEAPDIKKLRAVETVESMYDLADEIVGRLWIGAAQRPSTMQLK